MAASENAVGDYFADTPEARQVARGVARLMANRGFAPLCEVPLGNNRRADLMAINAKGVIVIAEIKVSRADLLGDSKWRDYLDYCDRYYWAAPRGLDRTLFEREDLWPGRTGLIIADAYEGAIAREAAESTVAPSRRRAETLKFARRAALRLIAHEDPKPEMLPPLPGE